MKKYRVEYDYEGNTWLVVTTADDGIVDVLEEFTSRGPAVATCKQFNQDEANARFEESRYNAMYAYACGERD